MSNLFLITHVSALISTYIKQNIPIMFTNYNKHKNQKVSATYNLGKNVFYMKISYLIPILLHVNVYFAFEKCDVPCTYDLFSTILFLVLAAS